MNAKSVISQGNTVKSKNAFGFASLVEYQESNGIPGYQPGNDTIVRQVRLSQQQWQIDSVTTSIMLNAANTSKAYTVILSSQISGWCSMKISALITTDTVTFTSDKLINRTGIIQVLTPSSFKVSVQLTNIVYSNPSSLLAVGTVVAFRGAISEKSRDTQHRSISGSKVEKPDDANSAQQVNQFVDPTQVRNYGVSIPNAFFSFQNYISCYNSSAPTVITRGNFIQSNFTMFQPQLEDEKQFSGMVDGNAVLTSFFMSITERVDSFSWDPSVGSSDIVSNLVLSGAGSIVTNWIIVVVSIVMSVAAFL